MEVPLESLTGISAVENNPLGLVNLVRTLKNGDTTSEWMTVLAAIDKALFSPLNGKEVVSAHVSYEKVSGGTIGLSGSALCAEYHNLVPHWQGAV